MLVKELTVSAEANTTQFLLAQEQTVSSGAYHYKPLILSNGPLPNRVKVPMDTLERYL